MKSIDFVVPCYNEEEVLPLFYKEVSSVAAQCSNFAFNFIFVNDGSRDATIDIILAMAERDKRVKYISFSRNFGKEAAMLAGMKYSSGDYVCIIDADLQHSPELVIDMLNALEADPSCDVAAARRSDREGEAKFKSAFSSFFYKVMNKMSSIEIPESAQDFRVMRRKVVDSIVALPEYQRFSKGIFSWVGFNTVWFEHENRERAAGETKWSFRGLVKYAIDGIINYSVAPLKFSLFFGILSDIAGFICAIVAIISAATGNGGALWAIFCIVLILGGIILCSIGILGEYLARIYIEVKHRPVFIVDKTNINPLD